MNKGAVILLCLALTGCREPVYTITAYCPCSACCGKWSDGYTATGKRALAKNRIIAVDPKVIPLHSKVYIEGLGYYYAEDTGSAIKWNKIDILFDSHNEALEFGVQYLKVKVIK